MKKIDEMIKQLCPNGVEMVKLNTLLDYEQPSPYIVKSTEYSNEYETPVLTAGASFCLGYTNETDGIYKADEDNPVIIFDDFTTSFHWVKFDFKVKSSAMKMLRPKKNNVSFRYIYFCMSCIDYVPAEHSRQWIGRYSNFEIPLPPLSIQKEIVSVLDKFSELIEKTDEEIALRQKQYEYYREKLLTFEDGEVEWKKIPDVAKYSTGLTYKPANVTDNGTLVLRSSNIKDGFLAFDDNVYVTMDIPERAKVKKGDILICVRNGSKKLVGKCAMITEEADGMAFGAFMNILRAEKCDNKYLFYVWQKDSTVKQYKGDDAAPICQITNKDFSRITIPLPSLSRQQEIVDTLDKFEALISKLKDERELRQKQYEYYRDNLLTF